MAGHKTLEDWAKLHEERRARVLECLEKGESRASVAGVSRATGVSHATIYKWMKNDEGFRRAWDEVGRKILRNHLPEVYRQLVLKAKKGHLGAIRTVLELVGDLERGAGAEERVSLVQVLVEVNRRVGAMGREPKIQDAQLVVDEAEVAREVDRVMGIEGNGNVGTAQ